MANQIWTETLQSPKYCKHIFEDIFSVFYKHFIVIQTFGNSLNIALNKNLHQKTTTNQSGKLSSVTF